MKPIIFLAFANDLVDYTHHLRNLSLEQKGIINALQIAQTHDLCEIVVQNNTTIADIFQTFQNPRYQDRIAVFHYGGHADGYQFLLNTAKGENQIAHAGGLVGFLAQQKGLQVVFLNGCSTQQQSEELSQNGLAAVIGTSNSIDDQIATDLAIYFYEALGKGISLERAWNEALWRIKTQHKDQKALFRKGKDEQDRFPWDLRIAEGKEKIKYWNLPDTAQNPLFGLPEIPKNYGFPAQPFRFLEYYQAQHAQVFFGRSYPIRELYDKITDRQSASVLLFYGQSGAGKSSLLEAGLLPRLENDWTVIYLRRNREGLLETLKNALLFDKNEEKNQQWIVDIEHILDTVKEIPKKQISQILNQYKNQPSENWAKAWANKEIEKPLLVILDQAEELFTQNQHNGHELADFLAVLEQIFVRNKEKIKGKLILSYRKEYQAEFEEAFQNKGLPKEKVFLQRLSRRDILEIFRGLNENKFQNHYQIHIEKELDSLVADALLQDADSPVAPMLQILLSKFWKEAQKNEAEQRIFDKNLYQKLHEKGILLGDFFEEQLSQIRQEFQFLDQMGVSLDLLNLHTTHLGTAGSKNLDELRQIYQQQSHYFEDLQKLKEKLTNLYVLTSPQKDLTSLAHDSLAPIVKDAFRKSEKNLPRALRILENKIQESAYNPENVLEEDELVLVEKLGEIRILNQKEQNLVKRSQERKAQLEKERQKAKRNRQLLRVFVVAFAFFASAMWYKTHQENQANELLNQALQNENSNPTKALALAKQAFSVWENENIQTTIYQFVAKHQFYQQDFEGHTSRVKSVVFFDDSTIVSGSEDSTVRIWNLEGKTLKTLPHSNFVRSVFLQNDTLLSTTKDSTYFWDKKGVLLKKIQGEKILPKDSLPLGFENINDWTTHQKQFFVALKYPEKNVKMYDQDGNLLKTFVAHTDEVSSIAISPNGKFLLTGSYDKTLKLWNLQGRADWKVSFENRPLDLFLENKNIHFALSNTIYLADNQGFIKDSVKFKNDISAIQKNEKTLLVALDTVLEIWDWQSKKVQKTIPLPKTIRKILVGKDQFILDQENAILVLDKKGKLLKSLEAHQNTIMNLAFSPTENKLLSVGYDSTAIVWNTETWEKEAIFKQNEVFSAGIFLDENTIFLGDWSGRLQKVDLKSTQKQPFQIAKDFINQIVLMPNKKEILVASFDKNVYLCDLEGNILQIFSGHTDSVDKIAVSEDGTYFVSLSADNSLMKWSVDIWVYLNSGRVAK